MSNFELQDEQQAGLQQIAGVIAEESAVVLSTLLDKKIEISAEDTGAADAEDLGSMFDGEAVVVQCAFATGFDATNHMLFDKSLVATVSDLMMMGDGTAEFSEDHIDAIQEGVNQMMGAAATSLSGTLNKSVDFQPSSASLSTVEDSGIELDDQTSSKFEIQIEGESKGQFVLLMPYSVIEEAARSMSSGGAEEAGAGEMEAGGDLDMDLGDLDAAAAGMPSEGGEEEGDFAAAAPAAPRMPSMSGISDKERERLELLLDVKLDISIELGRTKMLVRDILELGPGSVIELDKMAGETVDLLINDKKLAEGEVVVVDENFGVRITHLITMEERIKMLQAS